MLHRSAPEELSRTIQIPQWVADIRAISGKSCTPFCILLPALISSQRGGSTASRAAVDGRLEGKRRDGLIPDLCGGAHVAVALNHHNPTSRGSKLLYGAGICCLDGNTDSVAILAVKNVPGTWHLQAGRPMVFKDCNFHYLILQGPKPVSIFWVTAHQPRSPSATPEQCPPVYEKISTSPSFNLRTLVTPSNVMQAMRLLSPNPLGAVYIGLVLHD
ncbi:hypothetical protein FB451DRAFT_1189799 [Mycena latifolia]|nr:hypothetical protein FB451DRAFT_1189799 [Mycena latifolia]